MIIFKKSDEINRYLSKELANHQSIGFVPTMGALHEGHLSLIRQSNKDNQITVCSIFVNPTQFNNPEDFKKYPISIEDDIQMLENEHCSILFLPSVDEIYPGEFVKKHYDLGELENILEGKYRPGHYQGVCMVVDRLLSIIPSQKLYLGQKDYQQCMVIEKMVTQRNYNIQIEIMPTIREDDGLAMSSRNRRLNESDRKKSLAINKALLHIKNNLSKSDRNKLIADAEQMLITSGFDVDYIEILQSDLSPIDQNSNNKKWVALIAATIGNIRLIDNMILN